MQIFVKQSPRPLDREIAKPSAIHELERNIKVEKANLESKRIQDPSQSLKNIKMFQKTLDDHKPTILSGEEKSYLWKRAKALKDRFTIGMLSQDELHPVRSIHTEKGIQVVVDESKMNLKHTVDQQVKWNNQNSPLVKEFKNIMRQLNPQDPNAGDIEKYRPR